jgi:hypothetical protein
MPHGSQTLNYRIKERPEDARPGGFEVAPKFILGAPAVLWNVRQTYENGTVTEVGPTDHILYAVQHDRACRFKQHFLGIRIELANRETAAGGQPAERVRYPTGQSGQIVEGEQMPIVGSYHQFAFFAR